jgi:hypothetical protein
VWFAGARLRHVQTRELEFTIGSCGRPSLPTVEMPPASRSGLTHCLGLIGGAVMFFLVFAAIFNGAWPLLLAFALCYAGAGAVGVRRGGVSPVPFAFVLVLPAFPWILWLFPAVVAEDGLLRALWWPGIVLIAWALAWLGGWAAARASSRE